MDFGITALAPPNQICNHFYLRVASFTTTVPTIYAERLNIQAEDSQTTHYNRTLTRNLQQPAGNPAYNLQQPVQESDHILFSIQPQ